MLVSQGCCVPREAVILNRKVAGLYVGAIINPQSNGVVGQSVLSYSNCSHITVETRAVLAKANTIGAVADLVAADGQAACARTVKDSDTHTIVAYDVILD